MNTDLGVAALIVAGIAAVGAIVAARIAASASTKTTRLATQLAGAGELQKWQREEFLTLVSEFLAAGHKHRISVDALLRPTATIPGRGTRQPGKNCENLSSSCGNFRSSQVRASRMPRILSTSGTSPLRLNTRLPVPATPTGGRWLSMTSSPADNAFVAAARVELGVDN